MQRLVRARAMLSAAALLAGMATGREPAAGHGFDTVPVHQAFWLPDDEGHYGLGTPALSAFAVQWSIGDAAAVILPGDWPDGLRERLVEALLQNGAMVVEMPEPVSRLPRAEALRRDLGNALVGLREIEGAGLVVAIGVGEAGAVALEVAAGPPRAGHVYAGAMRLGPGPAVFLGREVDPAEAWPARVPMLCALLARAGAGAASSFAADCASGLVPGR